ncbi:hypothetical protein GLF_1544 [Gluconobacter frateurii NBRC 101659]|nr:hypothetical protein GLF_1544 [Gluconobacter frateurii NBRC 101659]
MPTQTGLAEPKTYASCSLSDIRAASSSKSSCLSLIKKIPGENPGYFKEHSVLIRSRSRILMNITLDSNLFDQIKLTINKVFMLFFIHENFQ